MTSGLKFKMILQPQTEDATLYMQHCDVCNVSFTELYAERCIQILGSKTIFKNKFFRNIYGFYSDKCVKHCKNQIICGLKKEHIPEWWEQILDNDVPKNKLSNLVKGAQVTIEQLMAMMFRAEEKGFSYSEYYKLKISKNLSIKEFRKKYNLGDTFLDSSNKNFKALSEGFSELHAKVLTLGMKWIIVYFTSRSINNEENYSGGSHVHILTNTFGKELTLQKWIHAFRQGKEISTSVHLACINTLTQ